MESVNKFTYIQNCTVQFNYKYTFIDGHIEWTYIIKIDSIPFSIGKILIFGQVSKTTYIMKYFNTKNESMSKSNNLSTIIHNYE